MNNLEEIQNCPVEWKELGEVCEVKAGKNINKTFIQNNLGNFPVINSGKEPLGYINIFNTQNDPIGITSRGAGVGYVSWNEGKYFRGNLNYSATAKDEEVLLPRFLYFYLKNSSKEIENLCTFDGIPALNKSSLEGLLIPIPPRKIQEKIVQTLDKMTDYVTELTSELTSRKKQYSYYRDKLLSFEDEFYQVEWKTLEEVAKDFGRGKSKHRPRNDARLYGGDIPFIQTGDIREAGKWIENYSQTYSAFGLQQSKQWEKGTLCITIAANIAETGLLGFAACFPDSIIGFVANPKFAITEYVYYYLNSIKDYLANKSYGSAQDNLNLSTFSSLKIPVPSLEIQSRIVQVLDNFDKVCNDLNIGLPKEIELRQKQYEYWRKMMFNFNKKGDSIL